MNFDQARFFMVEQQIRPWDILDQKVLDLFLEIPRHEFVEEAYQALAYSDIELPIGENEAMMAPKIEARLLQALDIDETDSVLEIGTGSGFLTAIMASLGQTVTTVELHPGLQEKAKARLQKYENIDFQIGDASQDWNDGKQYDVIVLTGAVAEVPQAYKEKLNLGGRLAVISGKAPAMTAQVLTRISASEWEVESLFETELKYLDHAEAKPAFQL
ncbi:protein-L-isoaspartate O-methyltransferase family protein [Thiomicrorhabdus cannonii]|uniref:protein-L-isoaspartate O-methyltransferase family protein n=1 Tax=Thiomicrorhabdus cannonii TaxID=2748011 RepID=UPI0015B964E3|nr:protein-L-isoaspartate O-methyltransferase [Thiomicrorhabdus cannonii]